MTTPRVKICGHTHAADVRASVEAGADAIGVVADVPVDTPREVGIERAADLVDAVSPLVASVLVTMPDDAERAIDLVERVRPDALQIHGPFDPDDLARVHAAIDGPVIGSVDPADLDRTREYPPVADTVLVDSTDASGAGGTGRTHDWERTRELTADLDVPIVLAGGLTPENVGRAVETVEPFGVDVASGVASGDGRKDHDAVARFVANAKRAGSVIAR